MVGGLKMLRGVNPFTELRGYELRNQDILAASGAIAVKDSYASMNDDIELVSSAI